VNFVCKIKGKFVPIHIMKAYRRSWSSSTYTSPWR